MFSILNYFKLKERSSTIRVEVVAGFTTFLSLSYIFVLAPTLLYYLGIDAESSLEYVVGVSFLVSVASGIATNTPLVFAPGLEMLLFLVYVAIPVYGLNRLDVALCVFLGGFTLSLLALFKKTGRIHSLPPKQYSSAVAVTMSAFLFAQALQIDGLTNYSGGWVHFLIPPTSHWVWGIVGAFLTLILDAVGLPAPIILSFLLVSLLLGPFSPGPATDLKTIGVLAVISDPKRISLTTSSIVHEICTIFTLVVLSLWGSLSKVLNHWQGILGHHDGDQQANNLPVEKMNTLFAIEGVSGMLSGAVGISNVTIFVESVSGIRVGGRTGLTSVVSGFCMLTMLVLSGWIRYVNPICAVGALIYVSILFFPKPPTLRHIKTLEWVVIALMAITVLVSMSLFTALLFGIVAMPLARRYPTIKSQI